MSAIKPGSLCVIQTRGVSPTLDGRICTAVRLEVQHQVQMWVIEAEWLKHEPFASLIEAIGWKWVGIPPANLRKIDDPSSATNSYYTCVVHI